MDEQACSICNSVDDTGLIKIRDKGAKSINEASMKRGDTISLTSGAFVHVKCRRDYTNAISIELDAKKSKTKVIPLEAKKSTRKSQGCYNNKNDCLFCGIDVSKSNTSYSHVKTDNFAKTILERCDTRSDEWALIVKGRIEFFRGDLHAADCVYHRDCSSRFRYGRNPQKLLSPTEDCYHIKTGKPKNTDQDQAFRRMCAYLEENDNEQLTMSNLVDKMHEYTLDETPYTRRYLKARLKEQYGENIQFAEKEGAGDVVTMKEKAADILRSHFNSKKEDSEELQARKILKTAARLIKADIKTNLAFDDKKYPNSESLKIENSLDYMPETLKTLLSELFVGGNREKKIASIGHAIMQAVRPNAIIAPLQIGLAVQMHHLTRSKFIINLLNKMGFCCSYSELQRFETNAATCAAPNIIGNEEDPLKMVLFAADNVDHNTLTIDGKGTFHGMGIIAAVTPKQNRVETINREELKDLDIVRASKIELKFHTCAKSMLRPVTYEKLPSLSMFCESVDIF